MRPSSKLRVALACLLFAALGPPAVAQCVEVGPGTGAVTCFLGGATPTISCNGAPQVGNGAFRVVGSGFFFNLGGWLAVGFCDPTPDPIPTLSSCPTSGPFFPLVCPASPLGCFSFIDTYPLGIVPWSCCPSPSWALPIPNMTALVGVTLCVQGFAQGGLPGFGPTCLNVSHGLSITIQ